MDSGDEYIFDVMDVVRRRKDSKEARLRQANAVLAVVTDIIMDGKDNDDIPTPTDYCATLMFTLSQKEEHTPETLGAILYLLSLALAKVRTNVLKAKFDTIAELFSWVMETYSDDDYALRWVLACTAPLLYAARGSMWRKASCQRLIRGLLVFSSDQRPKIRKISQQSFKLVCDHLVTEDSKHAIPSAICNSFVDTFQNETADFTAKEPQVFLYWCGLLQSVLPLFPPSVIRSILEPALRLSGTGNPIVMVQTMKIMTSVFSADQRDHFNLFSHGQKSRYLDLIHQLMDPLVDVKPHINDIVASRAHNKAITAGYSRLARVDAVGASAHLPQVCELISAGLLSEKEEVVASTTKSLITIVSTCISNDVISSAINECKLRLDNDSGNAEERTPLEQVISLLDSLLSYQYQAVYKSVFKIIRKFFSILHPEAFPLVVSILQNLDVLRGSDHLGNCKRQLEEAVGGALASLGPRIVLEILPLNLPTDASNFGQQLVESRSYLLPLIKTHVSNTNMSFFNEAFFPLAFDLAKLHESATENKRPVEAKALEALIDQVWETFPSFCDLPTDVETAFRPTAKKLVKMLQEPPYPVIRQSTCQGLYTLITSFQKHVTLHDKINNNGCDQKNDNNNDDDDDDDDDNKDADSKDNDVEDDDSGDMGDNPNDDTKLRAKIKVSRELAVASLEEIGSRAKNFLPTLFNLVTNRLCLDSAQEALILRVIAACSSIASPQLVNELFGKVLSKILKVTIKAADAEGRQKIAAARSSIHAFNDVVYALAHKCELNDKNVQFLLEVIRPQLSDHDQTLQKKSYRLLRLLCQRPGYVVSNWEELAATMIESHPSKPAATKTRIQCLRELLIQIPNMLHIPDILAQLPQFLLEPMLALKDSSRKTKAAAFDLLVDVGHAMMQVSQQDVSHLELVSTDTMTHYPLMAEYLWMLQGGLAGSPHVQSATVIAIARIVYEFKRTLPQRAMNEILLNILPLLSKKSREVIKSIIGFCKVIILSLDPEFLREHLETLVEGIMTWATESKNRFKSRIRVLIELLMRKFGSDLIRQLVPSHHRKLIDHIEKEKARVARQKREAWLAYQKSKGDSLDSDDEKDGQDQDGNGDGDDFESIIFNASDDEGDDDGDAKMSDAGRSGRRALGGGGNKVSRRLSKRERRERKASKAAQREKDGVWITEEGVDFLDGDTAKHITGSNPNKNRARQGIELGDGISEKNGMIVVEDDNKKKKKRGAFFNDTDSEDDDDAMDTKASSAGSDRRYAGQKRGRSDQGFNRNKRQRGGRRDVHTGDKFRARKGGGDVMRSGEFQPYAFMPLDPGQMNKRKGKAARGKEAFANVIRAAQRGAGKGIKIHTKNRNMRKKQNKSHKGGRR